MEENAPYPQIVCDNHTHLCTKLICDRMIEKLPKNLFFGNEPKETTAATLIERLDEAGIQKAFALSNAYGWGLDLMKMDDKELEMVQMENDFAHQQVALYPDRLTAFFSINPLKDYARTEMIRCYEELHMPGLKLHFTNSGVNLREPEHLQKVKRVMEYAEANNIPVLIHFRSRRSDFGKKDVELFMREIMAHIPRIKIQMAHIGLWGGYYQETIDTFNSFMDEIERNDLIKKENFLFDISAVIYDKPVGPLKPNTPEELEKLATQLRRYGLEYILFGSDYSAAIPKEFAQLIRNKLPLSEDEFDVLFSNDGHNRLL